MATATLANKQSSAATTNSALTKSPISNIARYETTSRTRQGSVTRCGKWRTIPSQKENWPASKTHHFCELTIHSDRHGEINIVVFEDQGPDIWSLASLRQNDTITVVLCDYTSKSGRFRDTNRIWKIVPQSAADLACQARKTAATQLYAMVGGPNSGVVATTTATALLSVSTHKWKRDLNRADAYINF